MLALPLDALTGIVCFQLQLMQLYFMIDEDLAASSSDYISHFFSMRLEVVSNIVLVLEATCSAPSLASPLQLRVLQRGLLPRSRG